MGAFMTQEDEALIVRICVQSGDLAARQILSELIDGLEMLDLDQEELATIELVLAEVINNVVEHAYPDRAKGGPIRVHCAQRDDGLQVTVFDEGIEMPEGKAPAGKRHDLNVDMMDLPEGGFGWFMIHDLTKDIEYKRVGWENRLSMRFEVGTDLM